MVEGDETDLHNCRRSKRPRQTVERFGFAPHQVAKEEDFADEAYNFELDDRSEEDEEFNPEDHIDDLEPEDIPVDEADTADNEEEQQQQQQVQPEVVEPEEERVYPEPLTKATLRDVLEVPAFLNMFTAMDKLRAVSIVCESVANLAIALNIRQEDMSQVWYSAAVNIAGSAIATNLPSDRYIDTLKRMMSYDPSRNAVMLSRDAKAEFRLTDSDLSTVPVKKLHKGSRMFTRLDVQKRAVRKWGSEQRLNEYDAEVQRRNDAAEKKREEQRQRRVELLEAALQREELASPVGTMELEGYVQDGRYDLGSVLSRARENRLRAALVEVEPDYRFDPIRSISAVMTYRLGNSDLATALAAVLAHIAEVREARRNRLIELLEREDIPPEGIDTEPAREFIRLGNGSLMLLMVDIQHALIHMMDD